MRDFILKEWPDNLNRYRLFNEVKDISSYCTGIKEVGELLENYNLIFKGEKEAQKFFNLFMEARNNTKIWINNGYSPSELHKVMKANQPPKAENETEFVIQERKKIGVNDLCPCGSGKKYKKCCRLTEQAQTAQLSHSECMLFYETWYGLMGFINEQKKVINALIEPKYPNPVSDELVYKVREVLWKEPKLIDEYLYAVKLPEEKVALLKSWRDHHKKGMFFVLDYTPEYAVILGSNDKKEDRLFGIKGISRSLADAMLRELPIQLETVLLPFEDKIIYDGFLASMPIDFAEGAKNAFKDMYGKAFEHGITTRL